MVTPKLSVIVFVSQMRLAAMNTLYSLSADYQLNVDTDDYEILVIERSSSDTLVVDHVLAAGTNFRYIPRDKHCTPAQAINYGVANARANHICLMLDGSCIVTPRIIRYSLDLCRLSHPAVIAVPSYNLHAREWQAKAPLSLLDKKEWHRWGYRLFDISNFSESNPHGFFHPMMESFCVTFNKQSFLEIGGAHEGFRRLDGGSINLDIYRNLVLQPKNKLFILPGEGAFHQSRAIMIKGKSRKLEKSLIAHREEFINIRGRPYEAVKREPTLYGAVTAPALRFLQLSSQAAQRRFYRFTSAGRDPWPDDIVLQQPLNS